MRTNTADMLSIHDTNVLKGIAILLLLWHHLFYIQNGLFDDVHIYKNIYLVQEVGMFCKLCVVMFVFLSGYGLMAQAEIKGGLGNLKDWYLRRFKKLLLNYWVIWVVFVPISVFLYGITFSSVYQTHIGWQLLADLFGIHELLFSPHLCYNPTWWFYSCIIVLYLLFPLLYKVIKQDALLLILLALIFSFLPFPHVDFLKYNIVAFILGMWLTGYQKVPPSMNKWLIVLTLLLYCIERLFNTYPYFIDCIIVLLIVELYQLMTVPAWITQVFAFLGKHSMNIFLFHTFIFSMWFKDFIYASHNPMIIFLTLLIICLPISIALEWMKKYTIYKI